MSNHSLDNRITFVRSELVALELTPGCEQQFSNIVKSLTDTIFASSHEDKVHSTGIVLLSHALDDYVHDDDRDDARSHRAPRCATLSMATDDEHACQQMADGVRSFVLQQPGGRSILAPEIPLIDELDLFTFRDDLLFRGLGRPKSMKKGRKECTIIRRETNGDSVTALCSQGIVRWRGGRFQLHPYQYALLTNLQKQIRPFPWPKEAQQTIRSVLRIAVHMQSPRRTGSTFVVFSASDYERFLRKKYDATVFVRKKDVPNVTMSVVHRPHQRPLAHLIGQHDGAVLIAPDGKVLAIGAFLRINEQPNEPGTRHWSAQAFSSKMNGLVVVVSSEGRVSVFHNGKRVGEPRRRDRRRA